MPNSSYREPSVDETLEHPAYASAVWALKPHRHGKLPVAEGRGGPLKIAWEIHGHGPVKIVLVMGLAGVMAMWQRQTLYFGHDRAERYSVLVLDNRGIGASDKPLQRYTTSEMARDVVEVLDHVGWTAPRSVHVVGISLGGMIAQELACAAPRRLQSLSLVSTAAALRGDVPPAWVLIKRLAALPFRGAEARAVSDLAARVFVADWLARPDEETLPSPASTPRCGPPPGCAPGTEYGRFDNNCQRFKAEELAKRRDGFSMTLCGYLCQMLAAAGHRKSDDQLRAMADAVGRDRILVMHGTADGILDFRNAQHLVSVLEPADGLILEGMGHAPIMEWAQWFNKLLEDRLETWTQLASREQQDDIRVGD